MAKYTLILLITFFSINSYSQGCEFDKTDSIQISNQKMKWFVEKLSKQKLTISYDKKDIPTIVKQQLDYCVNNFDIANPDEEHQSGCTSNEKLPSRHLRFLAKNDNYLVLNYNTYDLGSEGHNVWIRYNENGITDFWTGLNMGGLILDSNFDLNNYFTKTKLFNLKMQDMFKNRLIITY